MGGISIFHWLIVLSVFIVVIPFWKILPRTGLPSALALVAVIPLGVIVLLWVIALRQWPSEVQQAQIKRTFE